MKLYALRKLMIGLSVSSLVFGGLAFLLSSDSDLLTVCMVLVSIALVLLVGFFVARLFWKCPHCKSLLPWRSGGSEADYCLYCGKYLGND